MDFNLDDYGFWIARRAFPSWAGYLDRSGPYGGEGSCNASNGDVQIVFAPEGRDSRALTSNELSLVQWFIDNETSVSTVVKDAIFREYRQIQATYGYSTAEKAEFMPDLTAPEDLRQLIGLHSVYVHQIAKNGLPYLGFELGCTWDNEHGLGVLMHGNRLVEIGGADTAITLWIAKRDLDSD